MRGIILYMVLLATPILTNGQVRESPYERSFFLGFQASINALAHGDLNGDGQDELIASFYGKDFLAISYTHMGDRKTPVVIRAMSSPAIRELHILDIDNNGWNDILIVNYDENSIGILLNLGDEAFADPVFFSVEKPGNVDYGDLNKDGLLDIVVAQDIKGELSVFYGSKDHLLDEQVTIPVFETPSDLAIADVDQDDYLDLIVVGDLAELPRCYFGSSEGFTRTSQFSAAPGRNKIDVADLDQDGNMDIVLSSIGLPRLELVFGNGDGTFGNNKIFFAQTSLSGDFIIGDFDGNDHLDVASISSFNTKLWLLLNTGDRAFEQREIAVNSHEDNISMFDYLDYENTGSPAFIFFHDDSGTLISAYLNANQRLTSHIARYIWSNVKSVAFGDLNSDGVTDAVVGGDEDFVTIYSGDNKGSYSPTITIPDAVRTSGIQLLDFNKDGLMDIITHGKFHRILLNKDHGNFESKRLTRAVDGSNLLVQDLNGDDYQDLILSNDIYINDHQGEFQYKGSLESNVEGIVSLDYNHDSIIDLVVTLTKDKQIKLLQGLGDGSFQLSHTITNFEAGNLLTADLDRDGYEDIIASNGAYTASRIYFGSKNGPLTDSLAFRPFYGIVDILDVDRDNEPEIVTPGVELMFYHDLINRDSIGDLRGYRIGPGVASHIEKDDFTGDGVEDLIVVSEDVEILTDKLEASISISQLEGVYTGFEIEPQVNITPAGLNYQLVFDRSETHPKDAGTHPFRVEIEDMNYKGVSNGELIIHKAPLTITADRKTKTYGSENPALTLSFNDLLADDNAQDIDALPSISTPATKSSEVGAYPIQLFDGVDNNYDLSLVDGEIVVEKALLTVIGGNYTFVKGESIPEVSYSIQGFVLGEDSTVIDELPKSQAIPDIPSEPEAYTVVVEGGHDDNYTFEYINGRITISLVTNIAEGPENLFSPFPNPAKDVMNIRNRDQSIVNITIISMEGKLVMETQPTPNEEFITIDVSHLDQGAYMVKIRNARNEYSTFKLLIE